MIKRRLRLRARQIAPLAAIVMLVGVPAIADTAVPGVPSKPVALPPPPPVPVPVPVPAPVQVPQPAVPATPVPVPDVATVAAAATQAVASATQAGARQQPAAAQPAATRHAAATASVPARTTARPASRRPVAQASHAQPRSAGQQRTAARSTRHAARHHRAARHAHARRHAAFAVPHRIARPLPAAVTRALAASSPAPAAPRHRAEHARRAGGLARLGLPPAPTGPTLLLILGGLGLATLAAGGLMPNGLRNTSFGRMMRRRRARRALG